MAAGTVILRPSADISLGHPVYPEGMKGYMAISEEVSDGSATYIGVLDASDSGGGSSIFELTRVETYKINKVISAKLRLDWMVRSNYQEGNSSVAWMEVTIYCEENAIYTFRDAVKNGGKAPDVLLDVPDIASAFNNYLETSGYIPKVSASISSGYEGHGNKTPVDCALTTLTIILECELGINVYKKVNGAVKAATATYRKLGGSWAEITEEEAKDVLKNNIITEGMT
ncbi:MAG: hypothetical protein IKJ13_07555 [Clostridia bacterium]|nr:hypothetical protein [Clostridia bacterium]